ncbi:MAG: hypothetical protein PUB29_00610 [Bacteroidales bacterium]|nr:hypothetical protein [Bacteroidales bacterium]
MEDYFSDTGKKRQLEMALFWGSFEENGENVGWDMNRWTGIVDNIRLEIIQ